MLIATPHPLVTSSGFAGPPAYAIIVGDSLASTDYATPSGNRYAAQAAYPTTVVNRAVSGYRVANLVASHSTAVDTLFAANTAAPTRVLIVQIGTNNLYDGTAAATIASDLASYIDARKAATTGLKVVAYTITPRSDASTPAAFETNRPTLNTTIRGWVGTRLDKVVDMAALDPWDAAGDQWNTNFFIDMVHWTNLTQTSAGLALKRALDAIITGVDHAVAPLITSPSTVTLMDGKAFSLSLTALDDVDGSTTIWTKTGGADSALFTLSGSTLTMTARNFASPTDSDTDNVYTVQVTATDSEGAARNQTINVTVKAVPASIAALGSNLLAWFDVSDAGAITIRESNHVTQLRDLSGNNYHLKLAQSATVQGGAPGIYVASGLGGYPTLEMNTFIGSVGPMFGTGIGNTGSSVALGATAAFAAFADAMVVTGSAAFRMMLVYWGTGQTPAYGGTGMGLIMRNSAATGVSAFNSSELSTQTASVDVYHRISSIFSGTQHTMRVDGSAATSVAFSSARTATGEIMLNAALSGPSGTPSSSKYREIIMMKTAPTTQQITDIESYLAAKRP